MLRLDGTDGLGSAARKASRKRRSMPVLDVYLEFASTYSYPAAMRIGTLAEAAGVDLRWKPFLLGPIFKAQGWDTSPFNLYEAKGRYMWRDMARLAAERSLPFRRPDPFPQNSLLPARVALYGLTQGGLVQSQAGRWISGDRRGG
jgi:2-hydroxychromene-2-carboxylate isomerase